MLPLIFRRPDELADEYPDHGAAEKTDDGHEAAHSNVTRRPVLRARRAAGPGRPITRRSRHRSDVPADHSMAYRRKMVPKMLDAMGLKKVALIAHSQAGGTAVQLALQEPERYSHVVVLGTGSLLPPLPAGEGTKKAE